MLQEHLPETEREKKRDRCVPRFRYQEHEYEECRPNKAQQGLANRLDASTFPLCRFFGGIPGRAGIDSPSASRYVLSFALLFGTERRGG